MAIVTLALSVICAGRPVSLAARLLPETDAYYALHNALAEYQAGGSRAVLHNRLNQLVAKFPPDETVTYANEMLTILTSMVAEDLKPPVFSGSSTERRVRQLIFELRDAQGFQQSQPGSIDFLAPHLPRGPAQELVTIGYPAVPFLLEARNDRRLTRGVYKRLVFRSIRPVSECVSQVLARIGKAPQHPTPVPQHPRTLTEVQPSR